MSKSLNGKSFSFPQLSTFDLKSTEKMELPQPLQNELPSHYADRLGLTYTATVTQEHKKEKGQFFTPVSVARLMSSYSENQKEHVRILDPGCGTAILTCALIEHLVESNPNLTTIDVTAYETDVNLISNSQTSLTYLKSWLGKKEISWHFFSSFHYY